MADIPERSSQILPPIEMKGFGFGDTEGDRYALELAAGWLEGMGVEHSQAETLVRNLSDATLVDRARRNVHRQANAVYLDNPQDGEEYDSSNNVDMYSFSGSLNEIAPFMLKIAAVARQRFAEQSAKIFPPKDDLAFDIDHLDQFGDWRAPGQLDALVAAATNEESFKGLTEDVKIRVDEHDRNHPQIVYEHRPCADDAVGQRAMVVIRKRPIADIVVNFNDDVELTIDIFRRSSFLINARVKDNMKLYIALTDAMSDIDRVRKEGQKFVSTYLAEMLMDSDRSKQPFVIPCGIGYIARIRNPYPQVAEVE